MEYQGFLAGVNPRGKACRDTAPAVSAESAFLSSAYGMVTHPVCKSYATKVEAEKTAFEQRSKQEQNGHKTR